MLIRRRPAYGRRASLGHRCKISILPDVASGYASLPGALGKFGPGIIPLDSSRRKRRCTASRLPARSNSFRPILGRRIAPNCSNRR